MEQTSLTLRGDNALLITFHETQRGVRFLRGKIGAQKRFNDAKSRIMSWVEIVDDCWVWKGALLNGGYGKLGVNRVQCLAHRFSYEVFVGEIPEGLTIDHLCRNRACVNPDHLEAVTQRENSLRGEGLPAQNARKSHCKRGHPLFGDNLYVTPDKCRNCKVCAIMRSRNRKAKLKDSQ